MQQAMWKGDLNLLKKISYQSRKWYTIGLYGYCKILYYKNTLLKRLNAIISDIFQDVKHIDSSYGHHVDLVLPCIENWLFILSFYVRHNTSLFNILALLENSWGQTWISEKVWFAKKLNLYLQHPLFKDMSAKWYLICCINSFNWNINKYAEPKKKIHAKKNQLMQAAAQQIIVWKKILSSNNSSSSSMIICIYFVINLTIHTITWK